MRCSWSPRCAWGSSSASRLVVAGRCTTCLEHGPGGPCPAGVAGSAGLIAGFAASPCRRLGGSCRRVSSGRWSGGWPAPCAAVAPATPSESSGRKRWPRGSRTCATCSSRAISRSGRSGRPPARARRRSVLMCCRCSLGCLPASRRRRLPPVCRRHGRPARRPRRGRAAHRRLPRCGDRARAVGARRAGSASGRPATDRRSRACTDATRGAGWCRW